jgi:RNA polymerase sigma-70 factor, ECF subfamily
MSENPKRAARRRRPADDPNEQEPPPGELPDGYAELDALYQELGPGLVRYLGRLLHSGSLAEDIAQHAFLILVRKWPDVRKHPCPKAWLYKVARNLAFDTFKERSREFLSEEPGQAVPGWMDLWDSHNTRAAVREAVGKLPPRQREAVWLYYFCGFKQNEIAAIMQIQRDTVAALLSQARKGLTGFLGA